MTRCVPLDAGVVGLLCSSPRLPEVASCLAWLKRLDSGGAVVVLPDVAIYEVHRELARLDARAKLARLERLRGALARPPVKSEAWDKAAEFWASVRKAGLPTSDPHSLDADAILAAVAAMIGSPGDSAEIATTNVGHLSRFPGVTARSWRDIH